MAKRIVNMTIEIEDLERYKEILTHDPRLCGNVSKAIGEYIKQMIGENEYQKKLEFYNQSSRQQQQELKRDLIQTVLSHVFFDPQKHIKFRDWDETTLYNFVRMTRETSKQAEQIFHQRFGRKIYLQDRLIYDRK